MEALLRRFGPQVFRFGMKMCRNREDASDVLQETLVAAARTLHRFRGASSVSTWLYTIARSFCIKKRRKSKFAPERERSLDTEVANEARKVEASGRPPDQEVADRLVERALEDAIGALDPIHREVLVLRDVEGLSAAEVAEVLGIRVPAVKSRLHRARLAVRQHVAPVLGIPEAPASAPCPDVLSLFSRHLEGEIGADVCARMEKHLDVCSHCRGTCESLRRTLALCRTVPSPQVPAALQESVRAALRSFLAAR